MKKSLYLIIIIASLIGLIISSYLAYSHYAEKSVICSPKNEKCDEVLNSEYSSLFFNIPNSLIGAVSFAILIILSYLGMRDKKVNKIIFYLSLFAFLFVLLLAYLIFFVIKSFCILCFTTWILIIIILMCSVLLKVIK